MRNTPLDWRLAHLLRVWRRAKRTWPPIYAYTCTGKVWVMWFFFWLFTACYVLGMFIFHAISHGLKIRFVARMLHWWIIYSQCQKIRDQSHGQISKSLNTDTSSLVFWFGFWYYLFLNQILFFVIVSITWISPVLVKLDMAPPLSGFSAYTVDLSTRVNVPDLSLESSLIWWNIATMKIHRPTSPPARVVKEMNKQHGTYPKHSHTFF